MSKRLNKERASLLGYQLFVGPCGETLPARSDGWYVQVSKPDGTRMSGASSCRSADEAKECAESLARSDAIQCGCSIPEDEHPDWKIMTWRELLKELRANRQFKGLPV